MLDVATPRDLLSPGAFRAVTATVMDNNPDMGQGDAERIVTDALAFVATAATNPQAPIAPSRIVDEGWHALVLHTALYAGLCQRLGHFVHHYPERPDATRQAEDVISYTISVMRQSGFQPDVELWTTPLKGSIKVAADCGHSPRCGPIDPVPEPPSVLTATAA